MLQRLSPWLAAGLATGLVIILGIWLMAVIYFNTYLLGYRSVLDQKLVATVIEVSANNPEVQAALKKHIVHYLKSSEGRAAMAELLKSPEMRKAVADNLQSPEMRTAVLKMLQVPEFRSAVLNIVKDTPEMKVLTLLSSAVVLNPGKESGKTSTPTPAPVP